MSTGFEIINQTLWVTKDPEAQLIYTFDWADWLAAGDSLAAAEYSLQVRANDPEPLVKVSEGIQGNKTYVELSDGQVGKNYIVTVKVTTDNGLIDRRNFRVRVENRSA